MIQILINDRVNPVDLACGSSPVLRWRENGSKAGARDVDAYQVVVASTSAKAAAGVGDIWDSGKVLDDGFEGVPLDGVRIVPGKRYWATVRLWRENAEPADRFGTASGDESGWAAPATFGTWPGSQWQAAPIWADTSNIPEHTGNSRGWAFLRTEITLPNKPILWASLYATGASTRPARQFVYRMWANDSFVGCGPVFPISDEARVDGYNVTASLHPGANAMGVLAYTLEDQRFAAQLDVAFTDGEVRHYTTDSRWKAMPGTGVYPDSASIGTQYFEAPAENINSWDYPFGFASSGFDDSAWSDAVEKPDFRKLEPTPTDKLQLCHHGPVAVSSLPDGGMVLDFGGVQIGGVRVRSRCRSSLELDIRYGEVRNDDGTVKYRLNTSNVYEDCWHIEGIGDNHESRTETDNALETWGVRVFRYVELHSVGSDGLNVSDLLDSGQLDVESSALVYPKTTDEASFHSSNQMLNDVWSLCARTIDACNGSIYADSWTRERAPYEADAWIQQQCHFALDDAPTLARYTVDYLITNRTWPTEWPMYLILAVYDWWMHTGDSSQVSAEYTRLKTLLPQRFWNEEFGLIVKDPGESSHRDGDLVDWPQSERDGFVFGRVNTVINALASQAYADMAVLAWTVGEDDDGELFDTRSKRIRKAINMWLYDETQGAYCDGLTDVPAEGNTVPDQASMESCRIKHCSLHASAFVLEFGEVPEGRLPKVTDYLRSRGMACSVYVAAVYLDGLYRAGYGEDADALIAAKLGERTWGNMVRKQGGGTMEAWDSGLKPNLTYSHPWSASPVYLLPEGMLGIRPLEPGCRTFMVMPQLGDMSEAEAKVPVRSGTIGVRCKRVNSGMVSLSDPIGFVDPTPSGCLQLTIDVPSGCVAEVVLPPQSQGAVDMVLVDGHPSPTMSVDEPMCNEAGVHYPPGSMVLYELGPGHHEVRSIALS
ncbi:family 78 glycoside hydrolase catalytic domain [Bifidobacterium sp. ESL0732]|uniref:family 78 glycoside hydrolase catalytic domain n=1 Tax=Bifidobacterium sp. ESL0732 TaxID=2983222 RepID=UPI0023F7A271|nr:family 78 glycoside hydrolase catalytic domain [Bifidobacterium sp. ESL0732]WEV63857.1 family 78 glycoside hydrolase catalytic domain [Bifidobacterium sp. ESL0732]